MEPKTPVFHHGPGLKSGRRCLLRRFCMRAWRMRIKISSSGMWTQRPMASMLSPNKFPQSRRNRRPRQGFFTEPSRHGQVLLVSPGKLDSSLKSEGGLNMFRQGFIHQYPPDFGDVPFGSSHGPISQRDSPGASAGSATVHRLPV